MKDEGWPKGEVAIFVVVSASFFIISFILGYLLAGESTTPPPELIEPLRRLAELIAGGDPLYQVAFIFVNNAVKSFLNVLLAPVFGIYPLTFILLNGFMTGFIASASVSRSGPLVVLFGLLPHGVLEIPAIIVSNALGLRIAFITMKKLLRMGHVNLRRELLSSLALVAKRVVPILLISAFVEIYISKSLVEAILGP